MSLRTAFISDLHLSDLRPEITEHFLSFIQTKGVDLNSLYILGDLFDTYIGDDDASPLMGTVREALSGLRQNGVKIYFQHGNRDFLLGEGFCKATGVELLDEYAIVDLGGQKALLTHGDLLCTDDVQYLAARARVRTERWKRRALFYPLWLRRFYARWLRYRSGVDKSKKTQYVMDVNKAAVVDVLNRFKVNTIIHGHTHRPGAYRFNMNGKQGRRFVLGEWSPEGVVLLWSLEGGFKLLH